MTAFGAIPAALDMLYTDPNIGEDADYESSLTGEIVAVRVVVDRQDNAFDAGGTAMIGSRRVVNIRQAEITELRRGDMFHMKGGLVAEGGVIFEIVGTPELDGVNGEWTAQVREITLDKMDP